MVLRRLHQLGFVGCGEVGSGAKTVEKYKQSASQQSKSSGPAAAPEPVWRRKQLTLPSRTLLISGCVKTAWRWWEPARVHLSLSKPQGRTASSRCGGEKQTDLPLQCSAFGLFGDTNETTSGMLGIQRSGLPWLRTCQCIGISSARRPTISVIPPSCRFPR